MKANQVVLKSFKNNDYKETSNIGFYPQADISKIEKVFCLSKLQQEENPNGVIDTSSKFYKALTGKVLSRFIPQTRQTFSSLNSIESVMTPSESMLQHSVSITPIRRSKDLSECTNSDDSDDDYEHCHICKDNFPPEVFLAHIQACFEAKRSTNAEECNNCGKYYSDRVELDRHKCDGDKQATKRVNVRKTQIDSTFANVMLNWMKWKKTHWEWKRKVLVIKEMEI